MVELTDKDKYTYVTLRWHTYEKVTSETDGDEYDADENYTYNDCRRQMTYEEDNYITKCIQYEHSAHFNVNLPANKFIDKVIHYYKNDNIAVGYRIYFDSYTSMELDDNFRKMVMHNYGIPDDEKFSFTIDLQKRQDWRIETLVY